MDRSVDVAIVGAGPCGVTLANLLGAAGVRAVVLDRDADIVAHPRAVAIDDESLRTFQAAGVLDDVLPDLIQNAPIRYYSSSGRVLAHVRPVGQPYGWPRRSLFFQPMMEGALRRGLDRFEHVDLLTSTEVVDLTQDADGVDVTAKSEGGEVRVRARYVVGADGGRSFVRDAADVALQGETAPSKWLVVDVADDTWGALYSAVYCDADRPAMTIPLPYGHRRFEFKLLPDESEDDVVSDESVNALVGRFYRGSPLPTISRRRVYWHHSRTAETFGVGRVFLAGDAAHLQPPFFGQGMNSGIRDATNLAWKLAAVTDGRAGAGILGTYDAERRGNAETMVSFATRVGSYYQPRNRATEMVRDVVFRNVQRIPGAREYILQMKYKPVPRYCTGIVVGGATNDKNSPVGRMFGQPSVQTADGVRVRLDDAIGHGFAVLGLTGDPARHIDDAHAGRLKVLGANLFHVTPPLTGRRSGFETSAGGEAAETSSIELRDVDGAFRDMVLARGLDEVVILRPDRYVAAVCRLVDLDAVLERLLLAIDIPSWQRTSP